jgi:tetratricopeptide (TPR) repeat protein
MRLTGMRSLFAGCAALLACSIPAARAFQVDAASEPKAVKVRLVLRDFRYAEKSPALETIGGFLPGLLRASFFHYRWIEIAAGGPQADAKPLIDTSSTASDTKTFVVEGSLVTIKDRVRLNLSARDASNDALVFSNSTFFAADTVIQDVDALAGRMADALAAKVGAAGRSRSSIAVVAPFQVQGDPGKFQAVSTLVPDTLVTLLSRAQRETGKPADTRFSEISQTQARDAYDAVLTGTYSTDAGGLTVSAELREKQGPVLRFAFRAAPDEVLDIPDFLAHRVSELLLGRITETGAWRPEPLLAAPGAGYAALATEAERRFHAKDYPSSIVLYRKAIESQPREQTPRFGLAEIYLVQKDYAAALSEYAAVLHIDPASARAVYGTGNVYLAQGKNTEATAAFQRALSMAAPGDRAIAIGSYKGLGDLELLQGRYDQAVLQYEKARAIAEDASTLRQGPQPPADIEIYRSTGKAYLAGGKVQQAIAYLSGATQRFPSSAELKNDLATAYIESGNDLAQAGKYAEAQNAFRAALAIPPESAGVRVYALVGLGDSLSQANNDKAALPYLQQAISLDPNNEHSLRALGTAYLDLKQYGSAVAAFEKAISIEPTVASYELLGECYRIEKKYDLAAESLRDALRLGPTDYTVFVRLANVYYDNHQYAAALENLQKAIALDPKQEYAYVGMAETYAKLNDFPRAIENQNILIKISPSAERYYWLASYYRGNKDYVPALDALRKSIAIDPDYQAAYDLFRTVSEQSGDLGLYVKLLETAARTKPTADWLQTKLGKAYYDAGRYKESIEPLLKAVSFASNKGDAERLLGMAYRKTGQLDLAVSALEDAIRASTEEDGAYGELSAIYYERGERQKYLDFLVQLAAKNPGSLYAHVKLGDEYRMQRKYEQAIDVLKQATSIDAHSEWPWRVLGVTYRDNHDNEKALEVFLKANDLGKTQWSFQNIANLLRMKHDYDNALENANEALKLDDTYIDGYTTKAAILYEQKKSGDPIALLEGAASKLPSSPGIRALLAWYYYKADNYGKAADSCRAAIAISPKYAYAYQMLARVQEEQNQYEPALESARKAIEYDPADEDGYWILREIYHRSGRDAETIPALKQYLGAQPSNIGILSALGFAEHEYAADFKAAYEHYDRAYQLDRTRLSAIENFAEANLTTGRFDRALELSRTVLLDRSLSPEEKLSLNLFSIAAQLSLGRRGDAFSEVGEFLRYYDTIPEDYDRSWVYEGTKKYVRASSLAPAEKELVLALIEVLEAPRQEGKQKATKLANSRDRLFRELGLAAR